MAERCLTEEEAQIRSRRFAVKTAVIGSVGGLLFGFDLGVVAGALTQLRDDFSLNAEERGLVVSILLLGSVIGAVFGGYATDKFGRRTMILRTDVIFIIGSLMIALAPNFAVLLVGRFVVGIGVSVSAIADVAYLTEVAPSKYRGAVVSMNELMISAGFLLANFIGWLFSATPHGWRFMFGFASLIAALQLVGMQTMPKSPRWLLLNGKYHAARQIVKQIYIHPTAIDAEIRAISDAAEKELDSLRLETPKQTLRRWRPQLCVSVLLFFFAQGTGQGNVLSFAPEMFEKAAGCSLMSAEAERMACAQHAVGYSLYISIGKLVCVAFCVWKVDEMPRRALLFVGTALMAAALFGLGFTYSHGDPDAFVAISCMCVIAAAYSISFGPLCWLITAEMFTSGVRGRAIGVATVFNWLSNLLVAGLFETMVDRFGYSATFFTYFGVCCVAFAWAYGYVPETRHRQPEELVVHDIFDCRHITERCCAWIPGLARTVFGRRVTAPSSAIVEGIGVDPLVGISSELSDAANGKSLP